LPFIVRHGQPANLVRDVVETSHQRARLSVRRRILPVDLPEPANLCFDLLRARIQRLKAGRGRERFQEETPARSTPLALSRLAPNPAAARTRARAPPPSVWPPRSAKSARRRPPRANLTAIRSSSCSFLRTGQQRPSRTPRTPCGRAND